MGQKLFIAIEVRSRAHKRRRQGPPRPGRIDQFIRERRSNRRSEGPESRKNALGLDQLGIAHQLERAEVCPAFRVVAISPKGERPPGIPGTPFEVSDYGANQLPRSSLPVKMAHESGGRMLPRFAPWEQCQLCVSDL